MVALGLKWMLSPESPFYVKPRFSAELWSWGWKFYRASTRAHVERSAPLLRDFGLMEEKDLISRFMREIGKQDGGLSAYGEAQVRNALQIGAVDMLIMSEKLRKVRLIMKCEDCGWTKEETTAEDPIEFEKRYGPCPQCQHQAVAIDQETDIVEELSLIAESMGSKVKIVSGNSDEGELFFKAFGGIGAILRFRVG